MNFFKDPKYKLVRIVLLLVIIIGAGWFVVGNMNQSNSNQGLVSNRVSTPASEDTINTANPKINTISYYDSTLNKNIKVSQTTIMSGGGTLNKPGQQITVTCTGSCTGDGCNSKGCIPNGDGDCTACRCDGGGIYNNCSECTCSKATSVVLPNPKD
jgi:uncharacterized protein (UPF0333 family)